jgi:hypothetical protein
MDTHNMYASEKRSPLTSMSALRPYLFRSRLPEDAVGYVYILCARDKEDRLFDAIRNHELPNFAVVVAAVTGEPNDQMRYNMERFYGFNDATVVNTPVCNVAIA